MEDCQTKAIQLQSQRGLDREWSIAPTYGHTSSPGLEMASVPNPKSESVNKVRHEFRQIFFEMGFEEMPTNW